MAKTSLVTEIAIVNVKRVKGKNFSLLSWTGYKFKIIGEVQVLMPKETKTRSPMAGTV